MTSSDRCVWEDRQVGIATSCPWSLGNQVLLAVHLVVCSSCQAVHKQTPAQGGLTVLQDWQQCLILAFSVRNCLAQPPVSATKVTFVSQLLPAFASQSLWNSGGKKRGVY